MKNYKEVVLDTKVYKLLIGCNLYELFTIQKVRAKQLEINFSLAIIIEGEKEIPYSEDIYTTIDIKEIANLKEATRDEVDMYYREVEKLSKGIDHVINNIHY